MRRIPIGHLVLCALALVAGPLANAQLEIEITRGAGKQTPIAVVPFGWQGNPGSMPEDIASIVAADLERSGRFAPLPEGDMLQKPTTGTDVDFSDWSILGVEAVVVGQLIETGENAYTVQFQLFDVFGRQQLVGYRMPASRGTLRQAAHRVADMVFEDDREGHRHFAAFLEQRGAVEYLCRRIEALQQEANQTGTTET